MEEKKYIVVHNGGMDAVLQNSSITSGRSGKNLMIEKLDTFIGRYKTTSLYIENERHCSVMKQLIRARREFESTRFFVLVVGPVKSGKSSFVNILARNTVSPTDVTECTAIPTIIGKAEDAHRNKIVRYIPNFQDLDNGEVFDDVIDVLRGIASPSIFEERIKLKEDECSNENLKRFLTVSFSVNASGEAMPLLATIGIEETPFVNDEIMVIDMPGLDGGEINWNNNPLYIRMVKRADFIFFVQSSTTTINESSVDFLRWLLNNKETNVPLRLIHNEHDSLYFLNEEIRKAKVEKQVEAAKRFILANISNQHDLDFNNYVLNLAKIGKSLVASHEISEKFREILEKGKVEYENEEIRIVDELKEKRLLYKEQNCINRSIHHISLAKQEYGLIWQIVHDRLSDIENVISNYFELRNLMEKMEISFAQLKEDFENRIISERIETRYIDEIKQTTKLYIERNIGKEFSGKELKGHIDKLVEKYNRIPLLDKNSSIYKSLEKGLRKVIYEKFNESLKEIRKLLQMTEDSFHVYIEFQKYLKFTPYYKGINAKTYLFGLEKVYKVDECRDKINSFKQYIIEDSFPVVFKEYKKNIFKSFEGICKIWRNDMYTELNQQFEIIKEKLEGEKIHLKEQEILLRDILIFLN